MVFLRQNRVGIAFTIDRDEAGESLRQEDAEILALRELAKAGIPEPNGVTIEAYENPSGWLVFCTVDPEAEIYIHFEHEDDFLDGINAHGTNGVKLRGWKTGGYTVRVTGSRGRVSSFAARLSEYGHAFEAPPGYATHLEDQSI